MHRNWKFFFILGPLAIGLTLFFQNCGNIKLSPGGSSSLACKETMNIASVREPSQVRFFMATIPTQEPVNQEFMWRVTFGDEVIATQRGSQVEIQNETLVACRRYKVQVDRTLACDQSKFISTDYIHGDDCAPVIEPEEPEPEDPPEPIQYGADSCPLQPIPVDDGCPYKDALGNDEVPSDNHNGMTVASNRQTNARFIYGPYGSRQYNRPVTSFDTVFNALEGDRAVCGPNCGPVSEGFGFPSQWGTNTHVRIQVGKFIALKLRVPTGNRWHNVGGRITGYSHIQTVGFGTSFARCPGQFRNSNLAPLLPQCAHFVAESGGELFWEIVPPGGIPQNPFACPLEPGQTYYMNLIQSELGNTHDLSQTAVCNMNNYDPPSWPDTCGAVMNVGDFSTYENGQFSMGCGLN